MAFQIIKSATELKALYESALAQALSRQAAGKPDPRIPINDGGNLRLVVSASGSASWQLLYRMPGRAERAYTLGKYPMLSLKVARECAQPVRELVAKGIDPNAQKQQKRRAQAAEIERVTGDSVSKILDDFLSEYERQNKAARSITTMRRSFNYNVIPSLGEQVAKTVTAEQIEAMLRRVEARGAHETRRRLGSWLRGAFKLARIKPNPVAEVDMSDFKRPVKSRQGHAGATNPALLAQVLRTIDAFEGSKLTRAALLLHARTFVRPDELRLANWSQVRGDMLHVQVVLTQGTFEHLVPLAPQSLALLDSIRGIHPTFVLPGTRHGQRMSDSTLGRQLHALGWKNVQTAHGFRKSATTLLNEMGWNDRWVEMQMSHLLKAEGSEGVYNMAKYLAQRIPMMACWSDYIDALLDPQSGADQMVPMRWRQQWLARQESDSFAAFGGVKPW